MRLKPRQLILNIQPESPPAFDNFLPGDNLELLLALDTLARGELRESMLYLWGPPGSGRSHLLIACVAAAHAHARNAVYLDAQTPLPEALPELLAIDNVDRLDDANQTLLFGHINQAREQGRAVLAAGPDAPARLALRPELKSRLAWGLTFALKPLNEADRATAVRERARARGIDLPDEVVRYLLMHARRDLPSLLATVDRLDERSLSLKRPITIPLAREVLERH